MLWLDQYAQHVRVLMFATAADAMRIYFSTTRFYTESYPLFGNKAKMVRKTWPSDGRLDIMLVSGQCQHMQPSMG